MLILIQVMHCKYDKCEIYQTRVRVLLFVFASFEFQLQIYLLEDIATIKTLSQNISALCLNVETTKYTKVYTTKMTTML